MKKLKRETRIYNCDIPVVGLTGGIATGKTTVSNYLKEYGFTIICADELVKQIYAWPETYQFIKNNYPQVINNECIDFKHLRELFFKDNSVKVTIENYLYSKLPDEFHKVKVSSAFIIFDAPVLFEKKLNEMVDLSICVYIPKTMQLERLIKRDGINPELAKRILSAQISIEEKKKNSDFVIDNSSDLKKTKLQVDELGAKLKSIF